MRNRDEQPEREAVRDWVRECPLCQKLRNTGIAGLPPLTLSLKPESFRSAVGVDHVTVTPPDEAGNTCLILIVEHFSHFPQAYAAKDYSSETVARALFKHFCTFGCYDTLCSDPGSAFGPTCCRETTGNAEPPRYFIAHSADSCFYSEG